MIDLLEAASTINCKRGVHVSCASADKQKTAKRKHLFLGGEN
jgi:hypothetical protein